MDIALLETTMAGRGEPAYRTRQVWEWAARGAAGYEAMTNVPAKLREALAESVPFSTLSVTDEQQAKDGTVKTLFRTHDGHPVEAVLMRYRDGRRTICISSQSGCPLTCTFCATGAMQFGRNLTPSEILDQALHFRRLEEIDSRGRTPKPTDTIHPSHGGGPSPLTNCVFMGMGEPFLNLENVLAAARRLPDVGITHRRTTISTVGWLPGLTRFVDEVEEPIRLAFSLHAANPALRRAARPQGLHRVRDAGRCQRHPAPRGRVGRDPRPEVLQGEPDPLQPHGNVRRLFTRRDRGVQARARSGADPGDGAPHSGP